MLASAHSLRVTGLARSRCYETDGASPPSRPRRTRRSTGSSGHRFSRLSPAPGARAKPPAISLPNGWHRDTTEADEGPRTRDLWLGIEISASFTLVASHREPQKPVLIGTTVQKVARDHCPNGPSPHRCPLSGAVCRDLRDPPMTAPNPTSRLYLRQRSGGVYWYAKWPRGERRWCGHSGRRGWSRTAMVASAGAWSL